MELTGTNRSRALLKQNIKQNVQQIYILLCGFQSTNSDRFSGDGYEDPPVPISNTVVKLINAESTWLETAWEDRKLLIKHIIEGQPYKGLALYFCALTSTF